MSTPQKKRIRAATPYSPSPASSSGSHSSTSTPGASMASRAPLMRGARSKMWFKNEHFRLDKMFSPFKKELFKSKQLLSFEADVSHEHGGYWCIVSYPLNDDGTRVHVDDLSTFSQSHFWDPPLCMCSMRDGIEHTTKLFVPTSQSSQDSDCYGKLCLACPYSACPYFVSLPDLLEDNEELKVAHCSHKFKFGPGPEDDATPKLEKGKGSAVNSAAVSPTKASTSKQPKLEPDLVGNIFQSGARPISKQPKTESDLLVGVGKIFLERPISPMKAFRSSGSIKTEPNSPENILDRAKRVSQRRLSRPYTKATSPKKLVKADVPRTPAFEEYKANALEIPTVENTAVTWDEALEILLRLIDPKDTGVTTDDLSMVLFHCPWCHRNMAQSLARQHHCIIEIASDSGVRDNGRVVCGPTVTAVSESVDSDSDAEIVEVSDVLFID